MKLDLGKYVKLPEAQANVGAGEDMFKLVLVIALLAIVVIVIAKKV